MVGCKLKGKVGLLSKRPKVSKQVLLIWRESVTTESTPLHTVVSLSLALILNLIFLALPSRIKSTSTEQTPKQESVKVSIAPARQEKEAIATPQRSQSVPRKQLKTSIPKVLTSEIPAENPPSDQPVAPQSPPQNSESKVPSSSQSAQSSLLDERRSPLLPAGKFEFLERQRKLGDAIGAGAIAGDLEIPDVVSEQDPLNPIRKTEYTFSGYFDSLTRRFVEAWGGVRTLPPQSRFEGKLGEFIEYDVVINRDGSLRKIVNVSARREPFRDFSAVDQLVMGVFKSMFPFQPVPQRIQNDPLVIRKRIQFVGFKYTLY